MTFSSPLSHSGADSLQSQIAYRNHSQQTLRYTDSGGQSVAIEHANTSSMAYQLNINGGGTSESLIYTRQSSQSSTVSQVAEIEEPALLDGAKNILSFIEQRLATEVAEGATEEELNTLIQQGLAGFKQGYGEAEAILKGAGNLNDVTEDSITTLYQQVVEGFEALTEEYAPSSASTVAAKSDIPVDAPVKEPKPVAAVFDSSQSQTRLLRFNSNEGIGQLDALNVRTMHSQSLIDNLEVLDTDKNQSQQAQDQSLEPLSANTATSYESRVEYGRKDRFSFVLQTQDGDKVTIDARNTTVYAANYSAQASAGEQKSELVEGLKTYDKYQFTIEGELDSDEMQAIDELMQQVMGLADEFYNGNLDAAYEQALAVGYDQNEIASYSLSMKQVEQYSVASAYETFTPETKPSLNGVFDAIGDYTTELVESINKAKNNQHIDFTRLLDAIAQQIDAQIDHHKTSGFQQSLSPFLPAGES